MKKIFSLFVFSVAMMGLAACSEEGNDIKGNDIIWDIAPSEVRIQLVDQNGNNLLNPNVEGNWVDEPIELSTSDESYAAVWSRDELRPQSRAYMPKFLGLVWGEVIKGSNDSGYYLYFGGFPGDSDYDMSLVLSIPGIDSKYKFEYKHDCDWKNNEPKISNHIIYNGKKIEGETIKLTVPYNSNK